MFYKALVPIFKRLVGRKFTIGHQVITITEKAVEIYRNDELIAKFDLVETPKE